MEQTIKEQVQAIIEYNKQKEIIMTILPNLSESEKESIKTEMEAQRVKLNLD